MRATAHTGPGHDAGDPGFCEGCLPVTAPEVPATNDPYPYLDAESGWRASEPADDEPEFVYAPRDAEVPADEGTLPYCPKCGCSTPSGMHFSHCTETKPAEVPAGEWTLEQFLADFWWACESGEPEGTRPVPVSSIEVTERGGTDD